MRSLVRRWFQHTLYLQISRESIVLRDPQHNVTLEEYPAVAIEQAPGETKRTIVAWGLSARLRASATIVVVNPFDHPRSPLSDFVVAEQLLKLIMRQALTKSLFTPSPTLIIHPTDEFEGGLTAVEIRALHELGMSAGARKVRLWQGERLTDAQVIEQNMTWLQ